MKYPWFKLQSGIRNDPKLKRMPIHQRYAYIVLMCLASESEERGTIFDLDDEDLAFELEMNLEDWKTLKAKFRVKGLIEFEMSTLTICNWENSQYDKPSDRAEATRRRKQEQRARNAAKKAIEDAIPSQNVTPVTPLSRDVTQNVTQIRREEIRSDQKRSDQDLNSVNASIQKIDDSDFEVFREIWNRDRPKHWAECQSLNKKRIAELKKFSRENGDRSLEIFQSALSHARTDPWCNNPQTKLTIDNFLTNNKPVSWAEKAGASDFAASSRGNTHEDWLQALEAV